MLPSGTDHSESVSRSKSVSLETKDAVLETRDRIGPSQDGPVKPPRFRIFIVDSGWNSAARRVLHDNFELLRQLQRESPIYFLGRERSVELMRIYPALVGKDPIIRVHIIDRGKQRRNAGFHGFRLHLGLLRTSEDALLALQNFAKFVGTHRDSANLEADMRAKLRREGLQGALEIVLQGEAHGVSI
ncbi:MAG TPA: hypothetical protein VGM32_24540 [Rhodopila sp.]